MKKEKETVSMWVQWKRLQILKCFDSVKVFNSAERFVPKGREYKFHHEEERNKISEMPACSKVKAKSTHVRGSR